MLGRRNLDCRDFSILPTRASGGADLLRKDADKTRKKVEAAREKLVAGLASLLANFDAQISVLSLGDGQPAELAKLRAEVAAADVRIARATVCKLINQWLARK